MSEAPSLPAEYFERMFAEDPDPWKFETSAYEAEKFGITMDALDGRLYEHVFEIGCANGVLTKRLAAAARVLLSIDFSRSALHLAKQRCASLANITFLQMSFPSQQPSGRYDLIVMSEVVYYWSAHDIRKAAKFVDRTLLPGGSLLLVHWTGETDYPQSGDNAVALIRAELPMFFTKRADRYEKFRLDLLEKP